MLFGVYAAFRRANGGGPVIFAAHHHAFYKGLAAHVGFYGAVFGKRAAQVAFFLFGHVLVSFFLFSLSCTGGSRCALSVILSERRGVRIYVQQRPAYRSNLQAFRDFM